MRSLHNKHKVKVIIVYIAIIMAILGDGEEESLIEETCKRTPKYELCETYLESKEESSGSDLKGLAHIMLEIVLSKATQTLEMIREMIKKGDSNDQKPLAYCAELYIPVVKYSLPQAIDALSASHFGFANYGISDVAKQANACDKAIFPIASAPSLSDQNALLNDLSLVAAAIVNLLLKGPEP